jgi:hypothetical protein
VTKITHPHTHTRARARAHQQMHTAYTQSQVIHTHLNSTARFSDKSPQSGRHDTKAHAPVHPICTHSAASKRLKPANGRRTHETVDTTGNMTLTESSIKFTAVPVFVLCVVVWIGTSSVEVFSPRAVCRRVRHTQWHTARAPDHFGLNISILDTRFYFHLPHKTSFCAPACFGHLLQPSSGRYNITKTQAPQHVSVNVQHTCIRNVQRSIHVQVNPATVHKDHPVISSTLL